LKTGYNDRLEGRKGTSQMVRPGKNSQTEAGDGMLKNSETRLKSRRRWKKPAQLTGRRRVRWRERNQAADGRAACKIKGRYPVKGPLDGRGGANVS
jgi:hypothetical protein